ncbi:conserved hypothetical protein [Theileria orientalis strain Shintoku]|uniref:Uncharacterized protein n=1 Tax=Theileria orientalis strain Shintoku TaxID=869250 RepID=J4CD08_THEOR|nr:conserved hypothetical protein [Theileria orientalis strain Shintoku]BAM40317.1 conserved hypothetical protein [Theileria orientalis strain Shintoku]|eukprot:XP_009690618.1 conserved hypothetical protein [Theileria orientalis strain Shintoku]
MANIFDEIRIIFRGPSERLFVAYKPIGWHVCSPSGKAKLQDSLSSVVAAKLRISEDSIKFPSKLRINQKGLVIGTTDDPMYSQISKLIADCQCTKTYTCITTFSLKDFLSNNGNLNIALDDSSHPNSVLSGKINFNLEKYQKASQSDPDVIVDSLPNASPFSLNFRVTSLSDYASNYEHSISCSPDTLASSGRYSVLEVETSHKLVDKHLHQILEGLGIKVMNEYNKRLNEYCKMMQLSKIKIPHPILRGRLISSAVEFPMATWMHQLQ